MLTFNYYSWTGIYDHLCAMDDDYTSGIINTIPLDAYAHKLYSKALCHEFSMGNKLIGLLAFYLQDSKSYITNFSVLPTYRKRKVGYSLIKEHIIYCEKWAIHSTDLEVSEQNYLAQNFYKKNGFFKVKNSAETKLKMRRFHNAKL